jgi:hypothetical protein
MRQTYSLAPRPVRGEFESAALVFVLIRLDGLGADASQCSVKDFFRLDGYVVLSLDGLQ